MLRSILGMGKKSKLSEFAKGMRRQPTKAEKLLWYRLRNRQIGNVKFRRQVPTGSYIVDFVAMELRLVVELDGGQHAAAVDADKARTAALEKEGYQVIRFWNSDVLQNPDGVLERIYEVVMAMKG